MMKLIRIPASTFNDYLTCVLCGGYYISATAVAGCLHTFCKSCIVQYFETNPYCPVCDRKAFESDCSECLREDMVLQNLVYKLVPGLHEKELKRRLEFVSPCQNSSDSGISESSHDVGSFSGSLLEERQSCVCLIYNMDGKNETRYRLRSSKTANEVPRRYLYCTSQMTVNQLMKFIRYKFNLPSAKIRLSHSKLELPGHFTMEDVSLIYSIKPNRTIKLYFTLYDARDKPIRLIEQLPAPVQIQKIPPGPIDVESFSPIKMAEREIPTFIPTPEVIRSTVEDRKRLETVRRELFPHPTGNLPDLNVEQILSKQVAILTNLLLNKTKNVHLGDPLNERLRSEECASSSHSISGERGAACDSTLTVDVTNVSEQNILQQVPRSNTCSSKERSAEPPREKPGKSNPTLRRTPPTEPEIEDSSRYLSQVIIIKKRKNTSCSEEEPQSKRPALHATYSEDNSVTSYAANNADVQKKTCSETVTSFKTDEARDISPVSTHGLILNSSGTSKSAQNEPSKIKVEPPDEIES